MVLDKFSFFLLTASCLCFGSVGLKMKIVSDDDILAPSFLIYKRWEVFYILRWFLLLFMLTSRINLLILFFIPASLIISESISCQCHISYLFPSAMILQVHQISPLGNMSWQFTLGLLLSTRLPLLAVIER